LPVFVLQADSLATFAYFSGILYVRNIPNAYLGVGHVEWLMERFEKVGYDTGTERSSIAVNTVIVAALNLILILVI
jgi:hypothetical protein